MVCAVGASGKLPPHTPSIRKSGDRRSPDSFGDTKGYSEKSLLFPVSSWYQPYLWRTRTVSRWQHRRGGACPSTHATVDEAQAVHFACFIDIASVDEHRAAHGTTNLKHIERLELIPFCHNDQCINILCHFVGTLAE